ncbi:MAG: acetyltransferase [Ferruginibacter sp.]|nr:acetyltransferase [Ferruginibacter sp.]
MQKIPVVIIGSSGHAKVVIDIVEKQGVYEIVALLGEEKNIGKTCMGYAVSGTEESINSVLLKYPNCKAFIAIGDNFIRQKIAQKIISINPTIEFATVVHPSAQIAKDVAIGKGVAIMANAVINSGSMISDGCIINTKASVDHDCFVGNYSAVLPGVTIGGNVQIGERSVLCIGSVVKQGVSIGNDTVVGAGALVLENIGDTLLVYGSPAKVVKTRTVGEKYL